MTFPARDFVDDVLDNVCSSSSDGAELLATAVPVGIVVAAVVVEPLALAIAVIGEEGGRYGARCRALGVVCGRSTSGVVARRRASVPTPL